MKRPMKPLDVGERRFLFGPGDDPHEARFTGIETLLAGIGTAMTGTTLAGTAAAAAGTEVIGMGTAATIGGVAVAGTAAGLAGTGLSIAQAVKGAPKLPGLPAVGQTKEADAAARAAALAVRIRRGRASTILTSNLGRSGSPSGAAMPLKAVLGV